MSGLALGTMQPLTATAPRSIVLVGPLPPPSGGMANQTRQLAQLLGAEGCAVTLVQVNTPYRPSWIERWQGVRALFRLVPYLFRLWRAIGGAQIVHVMANSGWAWHLFAAPAVWIGALRGVPVVINYRGGDAPAFLARQFRFVGPTLRRAHRVVVPSGFLAGVFERYGVRTTIVPNIVNLDAFYPAATPPATPHLIVTRNLEPIYDVAAAIRAFAIVRERFPQARLTVAGEGPERQRLEALAAQLGVAPEVAFPGRLDNAQLPALYRSASVVVNASLVDNMPISLLEAMASGVPIVSTDVGGVAYLVEDGKTALLVPPREPEAMAAAIAALLDDPQRAARIAAAARAGLDQYSWPRVRESLFRAYAREG